MAYISRTCPTISNGRISTNFDKLGDLINLTDAAKFHVDRRRNVNFM